MAFDVPYVINGSKHSARLFRRQYQNASGEGSGVTRAGDLRVQPLNTPGAGFRVAPGGATVQSRDTFASSRESYGPVSDQEITVTGVPGTGSGESRRDLVIVEITDPQMESVTYPEPSTEEGWQDGDNFCRITIIQDVDSLVSASERPVTRLDQITSGDYANVTGLALAAINYEPSTATISAAMIEDLRTVQQPRSREVIHARPLTGNEGETLTSTRTGGAHGGGEVFPNDGGHAMIDIPEWATRMIVEAEWGGVIAGAGNSYGRCWVEYGPVAAHSSDREYLAAQQYRFNTPNTADSKNVEMFSWDNRAIPAAMRGTRQQFVMKARIDGTSDPIARPRVDALSGVKLRILFTEDASFSPS